MHEVPLPGCRPTPLGHYLRALAVLRLVAEQVSPAAEAWWEADQLVLRSPLDADGLVGFLADEYQPTPLLAPWNGGSGFGPKDATSSTTAVAAVAAVEASDAPRLERYRAAIAAVRRLVARPGWHDLGKEQQVALCRNVLPDAAVPWLDASVVLTGQGRVAFPFLLGTGGNDGRFDFSSNFLQRVGEVTGLTPRPRGAAPARELARAVLFDDPTVRLDKLPIGQFDPGSAGGVASSPFGAAESLANPWDLVLVLEGALVFASAAARRLSSGRTVVAAPFMVGASVAGHPSASGENSRGELWAPLWHRPATFAEVGRLISEGRIELGRRQARSGLDVVRAVASFGVDRGIDEVVRHAFLERNGLATFAVPVGRIQVRERAGARLLEGLDAWAARARTAKNAPGALGPLVRALDEAQFAVATRTSTSQALQDVLSAAAEVEHLVLRSRSLAPLGRLRGLDADAWLPALDDGSPELRLAAALASMRPAGGARPRGDGVLRGLFVDLSGRGRPPEVDGIAARPLADILAEAHARLAILHPPAPPGGRGSGQPPRWLGGLGGIPAPLGHVLALLGGHLDDERLRRLLRACLLLEWPDRPRRLPAPAIGDEVPGLVPPSFALLAPAFHRRSLEGFLEPPTAAPSWPRQLLAGRARQVVGDSMRRLRVAGRVLLVADARALVLGVDAHRLGAATLVALDDHTVKGLLARVTRDQHQKAS